MSRRSVALACSSVAALVALATIGARPAAAQYFGRNKVQFENFDWKIMRTEHFDVHYYPEAQEAIADAARMSERWYARHSAIFNFRPDRKALVYYADHPDFQQTNVIQETISEGTGGVTEGLRTRVALPLTGVYRANDHVIGHELVHVYQYSVAMSPTGGGLQRMGNLPLWLIEGMAEYLSIGREDPNTAMWMRDAALRNKLPTIKQLTRDTKFFPYRYGQALWAYIAGRYGDPAVIDIYKASLRFGFENALKRAINLSSDSLSKDWIAAVRAQYLPVIEGRTKPSDAGDRVVVQTGREGEGAMNVAPEISPDGRHVAFFGRRNLFTIDLYVADAQTGKIVRTLTSPSNNSHYDAVSFIYNSGTWSPDGDRFAFVTYAEGDNVLEILSTRNGDVVRRFKPKGIGAIQHPAWSPDGRTIAISGSAGGISDIYLLDVESGNVTQLTKDKFADLQPAWSPDGRTLAFASDRGAGTDFEKLVYAPLRISLMDVGTKDIRTLTLLEGGKHINPKFSPDGRDLYFLSDWDGFQDIYRTAVSGGEISRVTRLATGVSGITDLSPAMSISKTGRLVFNVFENSGHNIYGLDPARARGEPVMLGAQRVATAAVLPPVEQLGQGVVAQSLADPTYGLPPSDTAFRVRNYTPRLALDYVGQPSVGVQSGGVFGTQVGGGVAFGWGDMLGNQQVGLVAQASGEIQDFGGQTYYLNTSRRLNWAVSAGHIPYVQGFGQQFVTENNEYVEQLFIQRVFIDQLTTSAYYPLSTTKRFELNAGLSHIGFSTKIYETVYAPNGVPVFQDRRDTTSPPGFAYGQAGAAFVGDNSFFAFTSPVQGSRYRFEYAPTFGQLQFQTALADYRKYFFMRPLTLAVRGMHYARYGRDSEDQTKLTPLYLGYGYFIRGYDANSFDATECSPGVPGTCPEFDRLIGSRLAIASAEIRIPLLGVEEFGVFRTPLFPVETSPFVDVGAAWSSSESVDWRFERNTTRRVPVVSAGISNRLNLFGYAILEIYWAKPFHRPMKSGVWGFQLQPGW